MISRCLEAARSDVIMTESLWNLTGISAALLPRSLSNFRAVGKVLTRILRLRGFPRSYGKTPVRLVKRGLGDIETNDNPTICHYKPPKFDMFDVHHVWREQQRRFRKCFAVYMVLHSGFLAAILCRANLNYTPQGRPRRRRYILDPFY